MAVGERQPSGNGAFAGFSAQKRTGFAALAQATSYGSLARTPGFAAAAKAAEEIREAHESKPVKPKKQAQPKSVTETEATDGYKNIKIVKSGPRRIEDTIKRGFVRNSNASITLTRPIDNLRSSEKYGESVPPGVQWKRFQRSLQSRNGHAFRVLDLAEYQLILVSGEEVMPLITARLQKMGAGCRPKNYQWEMAKVRGMVETLNDTLRREKHNELDAEYIFGQEHPAVIDMASARQRDPEHPRWLEYALARAESDEDMSFLDQPLSIWLEGSVDVVPAFKNGKSTQFNLEATDSLGVLRNSRSRLLDIMGDVCSLDVSMLETDWKPTITIMETYDGASWSGRHVQIPSVPSPLPLKAPQANNCEV